MKWLRRYLVAGLLVWVPLAVTIFVVRLLAGLMDKTIVLIPPAYRPENLIGFNIPGLGVVLTFLLLLVSGILVANFFGREVLKGWERLLGRIPLINTVYSAVKQVAETVLSDSGQSFKKVMLAQYPRKGVYSLCFQTARELGEISAKVDGDLTCVFIPTTPNPTSGFIIMVPRDELIELEMEVDEALKMIVSLGVVVPPWRPDAVPAEEVGKLIGKP
ncbi:MAG: DUF502 domain-containing protein [Gammaproteobacteria bacterium]